MRVVTRIRFVVAVFALYALACSFAAAADETGNELLARCRQAIDARGKMTSEGGFCAGFLEASYQANRLIAAAKSSELKETAFCPPPQANKGKWIGIVVKFLEDHPLELHRPAVLLTFRALQEAYPCKTPAVK